MHGSEGTARAFASLDAALDRDRMLMLLAILLVLGLAWLGGEFFLLRHVRRLVRITDDVRSGRVRIYAWENFEAEVAAEFGAIMPRQAAGVGYYGGAVLPPEDLHHHGIALKLLGGTSGYIPPTDTFDADTEQLVQAGIGSAAPKIGEAAPDFRLPNQLGREVDSQALLAEGGQLADPAGFVHRLNRLMLDLSA